MRKFLEEKEIEKDPESYGFATHQPKINPNSKKMLEEAGHKFYDLDGAQDGKDQKEAKKKMVQDFMRTTQDWQKQLDWNKEKQRPNDRQ